jgi:hypothetical protein
LAASPRQIPLIPAQGQALFVRSCSTGIERNKGRSKRESVFLSSFQKSFSIRPDGKKREAENLDMFGPPIMIVFQMAI